MSGVALLIGCGGSSADDDGPGAAVETSECSEASSAECCEPDHLVWVYDRITDPDDHGYPRTIFQFHEGTETALTNDDAAKAPSLSPDGRQIVFVRGTDGSPESSGYTRVQLYVMNRDGTDEHLLLDEANRPESTEGATAWDTHPVWSPDGSQIAFLRNTGLVPPADEPGDVHQVMLVSADGGEPQPLPGSVTDMYGLPPAWSADSTRLAWITFASSTPTLYWASLDGTDLNQVRLDGEPTGIAAWVESDAAIVVPVGDHLLRIDTANGEQTELEVPALRAMWSLPTGELAGLDGPEERSRLVVMDLDQPHDLRDITTIDGSRIMPPGSVGARSQGPVTAAPALAGGWDACPSSQSMG